MGYCCAVNPLPSVSRPQPPGHLGNLGPSPFPLLPSFLPFLHCAGDFGAALTVGEQAWLIDIDGQLGGAVEIGDSFAGSTDAPDLHTFSCDGGTNGLQGKIQVCKDIDIDGDGAPDTTGNTGSVAKLHVQNGTGAGGTVTVEGDLGGTETYRRRGRRRTRLVGFWSGDDVMGDIAVNGTAHMVDIVGDLVDASINPNAAAGCELVSVTVSGEIRSATEEWIRAGGGSFAVSDSTGSWTVTAPGPHVFDGTVTARIG